jgi:hypothetical protein
MLILFISSWSFSAGNPRLWAYDPKQRFSSLQVVLGYFWAVVAHIF